MNTFPQKYVIWFHGDADDASFNDFASVWLWNARICGFRHSGTTTQTD